MLLKTIMWYIQSSINNFKAYYGSYCNKIFDLSFEFIRSFFDHNLKNFK